MCQRKGIECVRGGARNVLEVGHCVCQRKGIECARGGALNVSEEGY